MAGGSDTAPEKVRRDDADQESVQADWVDRGSIQPEPVSNKLRPVFSVLEDDEKSDSSNATLSTTSSVKPRRPMRQPPGFDVEPTERGMYADVS